MPLNVSKLLDILRFEEKYMRKNVSTEFIRTSQTVYAFCQSVSPSTGTNKAQYFNKRKFIS